MKSPEIAREIFRSRLGTLIRPYKKYQCRGLEKSTSIYDKVYHKWNEFAGFVLPYAGCNCFLTYHLPLDYLKANFKYYDVDDIPVTRWKTFGRKINLVGIKEFRPAQSQIISEIERSKKESNIWFVNLQTGQGKTLLSTYLSTKFNLKTLILCFSDDILTQWINTYITKTDIDERRILHLSGRVIDNILSGDINPDDFDIFLSTPTLLDRFGSSRMDYSKITELFNKCGFGLMIYDEAHRNVSNIVKISAISNVRYQLYLSADFSQGGYEREVIYKKIFANAQVVTPSEDLKRSMNYTHIVINDKVEKDSFTAIPKGTNKEYNKFLLVNNKCFSGADSLTRLCKKSHFAKIIGENTRGEGYGLTPLFLTINTKFPLMLRFTVEAPINELEQIDYKNEYNVTPDISCPGNNALNVALDIIKKKQNTKQR